MGLHVPGAVHLPDDDSDGENNGDDDDDGGDDDTEIVRLIEITCAWCCSSA